MNDLLVYFINITIARKKREEGKKRLEIAYRIIETI